MLLSLLTPIPILPDELILIVLLGAVELINNWLFQILLIKLNVPIIKLSSL